MYLVLGLPSLISLVLIVYFAVERHLAYQNVQSVCERIPVGSLAEDVRAAFAVLPKARMTTQNEALVVVEDTWVKCFVWMENGRSTERLETLYQD